MNRTIRKRIFVTLVAVLLLAIAQAASANLTGAIWTTTATGEKVNANLYQQTCPPQVDPCVSPPLVPFLNGGPQFAHPGSWLPDGDYYFQVTDPPGKTLLSSCPVADRMFTIYTDGSGNKHVAYSGPHVSCIDIYTGVTTIALGAWDNGDCDLLPTPNNGGVYKLWVTKVSTYDPGNPHARFGFIPSESKTDNFKVRVPICVWGEKEDECGEPIIGLHIILYQQQGHGNNATWVRIDDTITNAEGEFGFCGLVRGTYKVEEDLPGTDSPSPGLDPIDYSAATPVGDTWIEFTYKRTGKPSDGPIDPIYIGKFVNSTVRKLAELQGFKFADCNGNGDWDPGSELKLPGWTITLEEKVDATTWQQARDADDNLVPAQITGADGSFTFTNLSTDKVYRVCEVLNALYLQMAPSLSDSGPWQTTPPAADVTVDVVTCPSGAECFVVDFGPGVTESTIVYDLRFGNKPNW